MKVALRALTILFLLIIQVSVFSNGFYGIDWGTNQESVLNQLGTDKAFAIDSIVISPGKIGNTNCHLMFFFTPTNKLFSGMIMFDAFDIDSVAGSMKIYIDSRINSFISITNDLLEKYGEPIKKPSFPLTEENVYNVTIRDKGSVFYEWEVEDTTISNSFGPDTERQIKYSHMIVYSTNQYSEEIDKANKEKL